MAKYIIKKDVAGDFFWILKSDKNGKIVAKSSEPYESKEGVKESIDWTKTNAKDAGVIDETIGLLVRR